MYEELIQYCSKRKIALVAVTKTRPETAIMRLYGLGHRVFGENRVQELQEKYESLPKDIEWHMIGHLQTNKVKYIASFVEMIHSGASLSLLQEINKQAGKHGRIIKVLLQFKIGQEEAKSGWEQEEVLDLLSKNEIQSLQNIQIRGVMGMATFTDDETVIRSEFAVLKSTFDHIQKAYYLGQNSFDTISMGMSGDYKIAAEEGSTMVRIGSLLFQ